MAKSKAKFYAVLAGRNPGIYTRWEGAGGAREQVAGSSGARYRGFLTRDEAEAWLRSGGRDENNVAENNHAPGIPPTTDGIPKTSSQKTTGKKTGKASRNGDDCSAQQLEEGKVVIYTDGSCLNNPGPGGFGAVLLFGEKRKEIAAGFRLTTNNRMELTGAVEALGALKRRCSVVLYSDSQYMIRSLTQGWVERWRAKGWKRTHNEAPENVDLWKRLLAELEKHEVEFRWVRGHVGNPENERCDLLARTAASDNDSLRIDEEYERSSGKR